jgi:ketosteroid isomerase-like protein
VEIGHSREELQAVSDSGHYGKGTSMKRIGVGSKIRAALPTTMAALTAFALAALPWQPVKARADGPPATTARADADTDAIRVLIEKYARSIDAADTALASEIWLKSPDVSFIHPRGHERGWDEVKKNVYQDLMGATFSERKLIPRDVVVHVFGDAAWAEFYWDFTAKLKNGGQTLKTRGRETQVYRKNDGRWALIHVHYSGMPVTAKRAGF